MNPQNCRFKRALSVCVAVVRTHTKVKIWRITIDRVAGSKFVESWVRYDDVGLIRQLSLVPTLEQKK